MGGGTSGLFYGTKGSQKEYQYTLFNVNEETSKIAVNASSGKPNKSIRKKKISVEMVLKKCQNYRDGILTDQQLVQWLYHISTEPFYDLQDDLWGAINTALHNFSKCKIEHQYDVEMFNSALTVFENELYGLL